MIYFEFNVLVIWDDKDRYSTKRRFSWRHMSLLKQEDYLFVKFIERWIL